MGFLLSESTISPVITAAGRAGANIRMKRYSSPRSAGLDQQFMVAPGLDILAQDCLYHFPMHIGQSIVTSLEEVGEFFMIETQQVQQRRVQIMHVDFVHYRFITEVICLAIA